MNRNLLTYQQFLLDRYNFRKKTKEDLFDIPGHSFFKIMFHFYNGDSDSSDNHGGLLAPTWLDSPDEYDYYMYDSAWAYLKNNFEDERAHKLEKFITLLSNINSECPWYFQEITGLDSVLERSQISDFKIEDTRKKIQIKCLPDSFDRKIGTLLSLYREIVWSWSMKREVLPANLRKFDMSIFIWESPVFGIHRGNGDTLLDESHVNKFSGVYKLIELHNCEIDYNSIKTGYATINNTEGIQNEYTIDISFDDCYEHMYNPIIMESIGDMVAWDTAQVTLDSIGNASINYVWNEEETKGFKKYVEDELDKRLNIKRHNFWFNSTIEGLENIDPQTQTRVDKDGNPIMGNINEINKSTLEGYKESGYSDLQVQMGVDKDGNPIMKNTAKIDKSTLEGYKGSSRKGMLSNMVESVLTNAVDELKTIGNRLLLGNLYTYSISKMASQMSNILKGNPSAVIDAIDNYAGTNMMNTIHNNSLNNLAGDLQSRLNRQVYDRRENSSNSQLGSIPRGIEEPKPAAAQPYSNSAYDRSEPAMTLSHDIFPPANPEQQQHVPRDIFPPVKASAKVTSLGNLNKARTLINNI